MKKLEEGDFYELSEVLDDILINKKSSADGKIIEYKRTLLYKNFEVPFELYKYYFLNIKGEVKEEYARVILKLQTFEDNKYVEEFTLGINTMYNVVKITEPYDQIKLYLILYGSADVHVENITIQEIIDFKVLDVELPEIKDGNIFEIAFDLIYDHSTDFRNISCEKALKNLKRDVWYLNKEYNEISGDIIRNNNESNRDFSLALNSFVNSRIYCLYAIKSGKLSFLGKYYALIEHWIDENVYKSQISDLTYNDYATAIRIIEWLYFYFAYYKKLKRKQKIKFTTNIIYQANLLMQAHFNARGTNHGLYQDVACFIYSYVFQNSYSDVTWQEALKNIEKYYNWAVTPNGILIEHSPSYQLTIQDNIKVLASLYRKLKIDDDVLNVKIELMQKYLDSITLPNGKYPSISDKIILDSNNVDFNKLAENKVYKDEGYAIFRNNLEDKEDSTFVMFYNAYNSFYHKHSDENSLMIYKKGEIITEAGFNSYQYDDPMTKYAYSSWAHNSLIVNDKGLVEEKNIPNDFKYSETFIEDYNIDIPNNVSVTGVTTRYEGVNFKRKVEYNKDNECIKVIDDIKSDSENKYTILWILGADIKPKVVRNNVELYQKDDKIGIIKLQSCQECDISIIRGQKESHIIGWLFRDGKQLPTSVIRIDFKSFKEVLLETNIILF